MSVYDQLMARFKRPNKTSLTRQEAVAPTSGQAASNLSAPPLSNGTAPAAQAPKYDSYDRMLEFLQANQVADADADARARRREMFASIGDGISAISSLYQTTKGAPVTYTPGADMSKVMRDRYDRMIAQRKANSEKYLNYLKVQAAKEAAERRERLAEQAAKHQDAQEKYWDEQAKRWANADEVARQKAAADKEHKENQDKVAQQRADTDKAYKESRAASDKTKAGAAVTSAKARQTSANTSAARERRLSNQGNSKKSTTTNKKPTSTKRKTGGSGGAYSGFSIHKK